MVKRMCHIFGIGLLVMIMAAGLTGCTSSSSVHKRGQKREHVARENKRTDDSRGNNDAARESRERASRERALVREILAGGRLSKERRKVIEEAAEWLGTRYEYGCESKGVSTDCSGFVMQVFLRSLDMKLPRNSARQADFCKTLRNKDMRGGDLVFFATGSNPDKVTHVGLMIDEVNFIHASSSKGVVISRMDNNWYIKRFLKYGRVPGLE